MSRRLQENVFALILLGLFVGFFVLSLGYSPRARLVPLPIAGFGIVIMLCQIAWQNLRSTEELQIDVLQLVAGQDGKEIAAAQGVSRSGPLSGTLLQNLGAFGVVAALLLLFVIAGPLPAVFVFSFAYLVLTRHSSLLRGFLFAAAFAGGIYLLFGRVLNIQLNRGLAAPLIEQFLYF